MYSKFREWIRNTVVKINDKKVVAKEREEAIYELYILTSMYAVIDNIQDVP